MSFSSHTQHLKFFIFSKNFFTFSSFRAGVSPPLIVLPNAPTPSKIKRKRPSCHEVKSQGQPFPPSLLGMGTTTAAAVQIWHRRSQPGEPGLNTEHETTVRCSQKEERGEQGCTYPQNPHTDTETGFWDSSTQAPASPTSLAELLVRLEEQGEEMWRSAVSPSETSFVIWSWRQPACCKGCDVPSSLLHSAARWSQAGITTPPCSG